MRVNMSFDLPDDFDEYEMYYHARDYYCAIWDMYTELRQEWKHGEHEFVRVDRVWDRFHEILSDNGVDIL